MSGGKGVNNMKYGYYVYIKQVKRVYEFFIYPDHLITMTRSWPMFSVNGEYDFY